jgi:hypothetical protein
MQTTTPDTLPARIGALPANGYPLRPLEKLMRTIRRYVVLTDAQTLVVALWILHTYTFERFDVTPYLAITSPEKQCGKTTLLRLLAELVARPWPCTLPSEATVYRHVHKNAPTMLLDETDAIFAPKTAQYHEGLRAILNAGFMQGSTVPRCVGNSSEPMDFRTYCPKALAGIGTLPDTIADRSLPIRLQRKRRDERVERFRIRAVREECEPMRVGMRAWAEANADVVAASVLRDEVALPDELSDRQQDAAESLLALADALGYGDEARAALVSLCTAERADSQEAATLRLLRDVRSVFDGQPDAAGIATSYIVAALNSREDAPWGTWYGRGLAANDVAAMLGTYDVRPRVIRTGETTARGYRRDELYEAWSRYLQPEGVKDTDDDET